MLYRTYQFERKDGRQTMFMSTADPIQRHFEESFKYYLYVSEAFGA